MGTASYSEDPKDDCRRIEIIDDSEVESLFDILGELAEKPKVHRMKVEDALDLVGFIEDSKGLRKYFSKARITDDNPQMFRR